MPRRIAADQWDCLDEAEVMLRLVGVGCCGIGCLRKYKVAVDDSRLVTRRHAGVQGIIMAAGPHTSGRILL